VLTHGVDAFRSRGTALSPGTVVCTVVGDVVRPQVVEIDLGTPLRDLLDLCGGPRTGRRVKAVFPGVTNAVLTEAQLDTPCTYEDFARLGSGLGAAGFIVYDDSACMVEVAATFSRFLWVESCGQCPPCKLGTGAITETLDDIANGRGTLASIDLIDHWLQQVANGNRCFLPVEEQQMLGSILRNFPEDFEAHLQGTCPTPRAIAIPKLLDLDATGAHYDERQMRKRPDWTYDDAEG
jgi:NADH-quinone oxidoreductase subunit F